MKNLFVKKMAFHMSIISTVFLMLLATNSYSQDENKKLFLRVYTLQGEKIKGNLLVLNDSLLILGNGGQGLVIKANNVRTIKTKRSGGENILIGALSGAVVGGVIGFLQGDDEPGWFSYSKEDYALMGVLAGTAVGGGIGAITIAGKKSKKYIIDGNPEKWKIFVEAEKPKS